MAQSKETKIDINFEKQTSLVINHHIQIILFNMESLQTLVTKHF